MLVKFYSLHHLFPALLFNPVLILACSYFCCIIVPWAPGGSKFTRNPAPPQGVSHYGYMLSLFFSFLFGPLSSYLYHIHT